MARSFLLFASIALAHAAASDSWFLTPQEIDVSRGGHSRNATGIVDVSSSNEVTPLVNGKNVMSALLADIKAAGKGDSIHATFFEVNGDVMLDPTIENPETTKLTTVLIDAAKRGATLRILVNDNLYLHSGLAFCHTINSGACPGETCCAPETRHYHASGSLHAKSWAFITSKEVISYVGSMDVTGDRWDTAAHNDTAIRESEPSDINHFHGWHGNMFRLRGAAAHDVARHFFLQWNDPAPLSAPYRLLYHLKPFNWSVPAVSTPGNVTVQLSRTLSCAGGAKDGLYQSFAPRGEYSFLAAFKKMMSKARKYIYIEDQFVFYEDALQAVADALPHVEAVIIVTDNCSSFTTSVVGVDITVASSMRNFHQKLALDLLKKNSTLASKVHVFELAREGYQLNRNFSQTWLYTHSKNYMVDDEFMLVGSHGIERTGFTNDIEVSVGVTDGTAGPDSIVGKLRRRLFSEFLQLPVDDPQLIDPLVALGEFERQAAVKNTRVRSYYPTRGLNGYAEKAVYQLYEPDGRC